jgi:hypothetical protein
MTYHEQEENPHRSRAEARHRCLGRAETWLIIDGRLLQSLNAWCWRCTVFT